jgi:hypothetical protein
MALWLGHAQVGRDPAVEVPLHEGSEVVGMCRGKCPPLGVEALVHVEDGEARQRQAPLVHDPRPGGVPGARATGDDGPCPEALCVPCRDEVRELSSHDLAQLGRVLEDAQGDLPAGMSDELLGRNAAPTEKVARTHRLAHVPSSSTS